LSHGSPQEEEVEGTHTKSSCFELAPRRSGTQQLPQLQRRQVAPHGLPQLRLVQGPPSHHGLTPLQLIQVMIEVN
jgi:hypothetical protein